MLKYKRHVHIYLRIVSGISLVTVIYIVNIYKCCTAVLSQVCHTHLSDNKYNIIVETYSLTVKSRCDTVVNKFEDCEFNLLKTTGSNPALVNFCPCYC